MTVLDAKLKHLELIQAVINRMAQNSFLFKAWAITIAAGVSALAASSAARSVIWIAVGSTVIFWGLDGYYLRLERCFIELYDRVAGSADADVDLKMSIDRSRSVRRWYEACRRPHNAAFYGAMLVGNVLALVLIKGKC
jgi:hypothetical protein